MRLSLKSLLFCSLFDWSRAWGLPHCTSILKFQDHLHLPMRLLSAAKVLGGVNKLEKVLGIWHAGTLFYTLSTWGLALAGLYRTRAVFKLAALGIHTTSKVVMRAL
nr:hypothetical protein CFP56_63126 [Quercus suber]